MQLCSNLIAIDVDNARHVNNKLPLSRQKLTARGLMRPVARCRRV